MTPGKIEIPVDDHNSRAGWPDTQSLGEFDRPTLLQAYSAAVKARMEAHGFDTPDIEFGESGFTLDTTNANGSSFSIGFSVNDELGLHVDWASGVSVANGKEVSLDDGYIWSFEPVLGYEALQKFLECFQDW